MRQINYNKRAFKILGISALVFGIFSLLLIFQNKTGLGLGMGIPFLLLSSLFNYVVYDMERTPEEEKNKRFFRHIKYILTAGLFTITGGMFVILGAQLPADKGRVKALIPAIFCLILGIVIFIIHAKNIKRINNANNIVDEVKAVEKQLKSDGLIGLIVACIVLGFFFLFGLLGIWAKKYVAGSIIAGFSGGLMFFFIFLFKRSKKNK